MSGPSLSSETVHASSVAIGGRAVLLAGRSGAGKSDLALRLIDRGATLVSDDYTLVRRTGGRLVATAPGTITGRIEVRGIGLVKRPATPDVPVCLIIDLDGEVQRLPAEAETRTMAGIKVPVVTLNGLEASAPVKVELALEMFGLEPQ